MIRTARPDDVPAILGLIRGLADYEHALDEVKVTEAGLRWRPWPRRLSGGAGLAAARA